MRTRSSAFKSAALAKSPKACKKRGQKRRPQGDSEPGCSGETRVLMTSLTPLMGGSGNKIKLAASHSRSGLPPAHHHTRQAFSLIILSPFLQEKASQNSGMFEITLLTRYF